MRSSIFGELGELDRMEAERLKFERLPRGEFSDCEACERNYSVSALLKLDWRRDDRLIRREGLAKLICQPGSGFAADEASPRPDEPQRGQHWFPI